MLSGSPDQWRFKKAQKTMTVQVSLEKLLEAGAHFGHQTRRWNPRMAEFIYGQEEGIHIFDLTKTKSCLEEALNFLTSSIKEGKIVLLLGTKKQAKEKIAEIAKEAGLPYITERWLGGTLTNFEQVQRSIRKMSETKEKMAAGEFKDYTKKERLMIERDIERMERFLGGISGLTKTPDILFIVDTHKEIGAVKEANKVKVPVVGIVDTNANPDLVDFPIPMNDDASKATDYVLELVKEAILEGKKPTKKATK